MTDRLTKPSEAPDACVVMTTLGSQSAAEQLAGQLLDERLAACLQLLPIQSFYDWQGQRCQEPEVLLMIKTRCSLFAELQAFITQHHPYEVPELLQLPVQAGALPYLAWLQAQTRSANREASPLITEKIALKVRRK